MCERILEEVIERKVSVLACGLIQSVINNAVVKLIAFTTFLRKLIM